ncbi:hypothetical protein [Acetivibrio ethanolgignens]|nr:hypothetical protein [Acetivibrio ethanolgignens]
MATEVHKMTGKEHIRAKGETVNGYITRLVLSDLGEEDAEQVPFMN